MMTHEQVRAINGGSVIINKKKSMDEDIQDAPVEAATAAEEVVAEAAPVAEEVAAPEVAAEAAPAEEATA